MSKVVFLVRVTELKNGKLEYITESDFGGNSIKALTVAYKLSSDMKEIMKWVLKEHGDFEKESLEVI